VSVVLIKDDDDDEHSRVLGQEIRLFTLWSVKCK